MSQWVIDTLSLVGGCCGIPIAALIVFVVAVFLLDSLSEAMSFATSLRRNKKERRP